MSLSRYRIDPPRKHTRGAVSRGATYDVVVAGLGAMGSAAAYQLDVRGLRPGPAAGLSRASVKARACLYTVAQASRFVIDFHPMMSIVIVASPCSGHGFKHSAAVGESLAQLATRGHSDLDLAAFCYPGRTAGWESREVESPGRPGRPRVGVTSRAAPPIR